MMTERKLGASKYDLVIIIFTNFIYNYGLKFYTSTP